MVGGICTMAERTKCSFRAMCRHLPSQRLDANFVLSRWMNRRASGCCFHPILGRYEVYTTLVDFLTYQQRRSSTHKRSQQSKVARAANASSLARSYGTEWALQNKTCWVETTYIRRVINKDAIQVGFCKQEKSKFSMKPLR